MGVHLRACGWLVGLTVGICCLLYPLALWAIAWTAFPAQANGSLIVGADGKTVIGSRLVGQAFSGPQYFQPRPSAVAFNAAASGASNWGASNPLLRSRVARQLGAIARYKSGPKAGQHVGPDIEKWFAQRPNRVAVWAQQFPTLAAQWVKSESAASDYVRQWAAKHPEVLRGWQKENPEASAEPKPEELAVYFFDGFAAAHPGHWLAVIDTPHGKEIQVVTTGPDIQGTFFESWLGANPDVQLQLVPADMVTASGSGLDPDITVQSALFQLPDVAAGRARLAASGFDTWPAAKRAQAVDRIRLQIEPLIERLAQSPMAGLTGPVKIVNVLDLNLELDRLALR